MSMMRVLKKFRGLMSKHQKFRIFELAILMIFGGFLELCSVSLVIPFMNAAMSPDETMNKWYAVIVIDLFHIDSARNFLVLAAVVLAALYILKNMYLLFEFNVQYRFVYNNMFAMQSRLLDNFIHRPYECFLKADSSEIIRIVNRDTPQVFLLLSTLLSLFTEMVVSGVLIIAIFIITPLTTVCMAVILLLLLVFISKIINPRLRRAGLMSQESSAGMNKWLLQAIEGIRELKIMGSEAYFQNNYDRYGYHYVNSERIHYILNIMPRFLIEAVSMGAVFLIVAGMIYSGSDLEVIIPILSAVAMAAIRLLPSVNRISGGLAAIAYGEPMLDKLLENLISIGRAKEGALSPDSPDREEDRSRGLITSIRKEIDFRKIVFHYPESEEEVLAGASMIIEKGKSTGIVGSSGAGKTTAVDIILGLLCPQKGKVLVDGVDIFDDIRGWHEQVGYIPQFMFLLDDSIKKNVCFGIEEASISEDQLWKVLEEAAIADFVRSLPEGIETKVGERGIRLSGGQKQRICIARALYKNPSLLVFDEATSALDNETESEIMDSIDHLHGTKTMIIIAHRLSTIESCDHIYRVENRKIYQER